ncbi:flavodoxin family protein [Fibrobacter sp. UWEL]|uniref:flavodoxin family protein n=1 Tax=Fibrobacter sp. UWEL TaxID=1896209 RepID=UPI000912B5D8|nr:flavodoxin family protein [Fibrobacter sp. UWEL]SHL12955.1 NADPH-dependent FMN reductase [Fibrobacter sp. UWEL]
MKIVILNASPRPKGNISTMLHTMEEELLSRGDQVEFVDVSKLQVRPCIGCMKCRSSKKCVLAEDDSQRVLRLIQESDGLIVGSPCYWGNMTGQLKMLFDRMAYGMLDDSNHGFPKPLLKGKKAIIVSTCTTPWPFNVWFKQSAGAVRAIKEVIGWSGFKIVGVVQKGGTHMKQGLTDREIMKCRKIVQKF